MFKNYQQKVQSDIFYMKPQVSGTELHETILVVRSGTYRRYFSLVHIITYVGITLAYVTFQELRTRITSGKHTLKLPTSHI
jgi:hypothetical protein